MSKYIVELFDGVQVLTGVGASPSGTVWSRSYDVDELEELNSDYINEHFGELQDEAYQAGLNDAWEAARRIVADTDHGGIASGTLVEIFGTRGYSYIMQENTAQEAIAKIKAYDNVTPSDRIEVGDEVIAPCGKAVVTLIETDDLVHYLYSGGDYGCIEPQKLKKTGKHYDIASILEAMRTHD